MRRCSPPVLPAGGRRGTRFSTAVALTLHSDWLALVPHTLCLHHPLIKDNPAFAMFELPFATPEVTVSQLWHPRL